MSILDDNLTANLTALLDAGDAHTVGAVTITAILSPLAQSLRMPAEGGAVRALESWYIATTDLAHFPGVGGAVTIDGQAATVLDSVDHGPLTEILLEWTPTSEPTTLCTIIHYAAGNGWRLPAETSRDADVPCRIRYTQDLALGENGMALQTGAVIYLAPDATIAAGDRIVIAADRWRPVKIETPQDGGGNVTQIIVTVTADGDDEEGSGS